jgi:hypothetical protein
MLSTGSTNTMRAQALADAQAAQQAQSSGGKEGGGGMDMNKVMGMFGGDKDGAKGASGKSGGGKGGGFDFKKIMGMFGGKRDGGPVYKAQVGVNLNSPNGSMVNPNAGSATYNTMWGSGGGNIQAPPPAVAGNAPAGIGQYTSQGQYKLDTNQTGTPINLGAMKQKDYSSGWDSVTKYLGPVGGIIKGIKKLEQEEDRRKEAKQSEMLSGVVRQAAESRPEETKRRYVTPWDNPTQPNQMSPSNGVGTNILAARNGRKIGGNPTEIQNTYSNQNNIYSDLGYEPLSDSDIIKQYRAGGFIHKFGGGGGLPWDKIGEEGSGAISGATGNNAGGDIGKETGGAIGSIFGPAGKAIGQVVGTAAGTMLDRNPARIKRSQEKTQKNVEAMAATNLGKSVQSHYSAYVKDGGNIPSDHAGWMSHNWQPQVITQFGEHSMKDLLRHDDSMDTLRTGGHIRQNNMSSIDQYALGGELKTTWGGHAETLSHNPYMPGTGETVMFRGKSHEEGDGNGHTGIGVKYGDGGQDSYTDYAEYGSENADADVEVERGEPAAEMVDGETGEKNMVVYGNLRVIMKFYGLLPECRLS